MKKKTVSISSLIVLLSLISLILEICIYYFVPQHWAAVAAAVIFSLGVTHFSLESSYDFKYSFVHCCFMVVGSFAFAAVIYIIHSRWISYDFSMVALVLVNWLTPFIYSAVRDFNDHGPKYDNYILFFHECSILFGAVYLFVIIKQFFITPIAPPFSVKGFGAHDFVPYMSTGEYFENALKAGQPVTDEVRFLAELVFIGLPAGFYIAFYLKEMLLVPRIILYVLFPVLLEVIQFGYGFGTASIDDVFTMLAGELLGIIIYHIVDGIYHCSTKRHFMESRDTINGFLNL